MARQRGKAVSVPEFEGSFPPSAKEKFVKFLEAAGAEILKTTNPYEVIRCRCHGATVILYRKATGALTWPADLEKAYKCYRRGERWDGGNTKRKNVRHRKTVVVRTLLERDGDDCFYCGRLMPDDDQSVEHMLAATLGGPNRIENLVLAHGACNRLAERMSIAEKVKLRERMRAKGEG